MTEPLHGEPAAPTSDRADPANRSKLSLKRESRAKGPEVEERLHKVLAMAGIGSRRLLEERIAGGEIRINGSVAETGALLRSGDRVELDGKAFMAVAATPDDLHLAIYHKPEGEVTTHDDPEGRPTVFEKFPALSGARWLSIGRLDINTTGLLLLTSDGELANTMMHPSAELEREYVCRVHGPVDEAVLDRLREGVVLEDGPARFDEIGIINLGESHSWLRVILREGRNREVRRLWESQGLSVSRLKRIRYGSVELPRELRRGRFELLSLQRLTDLRASLGLGELPQTLTLQPVVGVRRAAKPNEFTPPMRSQRAWTGANADEGRELRRFDHIREDAPRRAKRPFNKGMPRGAGRGRGRPGAPGEAQHAQRPTWMADANGANRGRGVPRGNRPPRAAGAGRGDGNRSDGPQRPFDPNRPPRPFDPGRATRGAGDPRRSAGDERGPREARARDLDQPPRDFDPTRAARPGDRGRPQRPFDAARTPRPFNASRPSGRPRPAGPGGNPMRGDQGRENRAAGRGGEPDGNRQRGNPAERRSWSPGAPSARAPRAAGAGVPYGFPSDHASAQRAYASQRDDFGNRRQDGNRDGNREGNREGNRDGSRDGNNRGVERRPAGAGDARRGNSAGPSAPARDSGNPGNRSDRATAPRPRRPGGPPRGRPA